MARRRRFNGVEIRLVAFDFDGVLYEGEHGIRFADEFGIGDSMRAIYEKMLRREIGVGEALRMGASLWRGIPVRKVLDAMARLELRPGVDEAFRVLRDAGYRLLLVSCGGSNIGFLPIKRRLGFHYVYSNQLRSRKGILTGELAGPPMTPERKAKVLVETAKREGVTLAECAAVGNDSLDIPLFKAASLTIGLNPTRELEKYAKFSVDISDMREILGYLAE